MKFLRIALLLSLLIIMNNKGNAQWCQDFASVVPPSGWSLVPSSGSYWLWASVGGYGNSTGSAEYEFYNSPASTIESMITNTFGASGSGDSLKFDHAYCTYTTEDDQLAIYTSTNGGATFSQLVLLHGGVSGELVTAPPSLTYFTPVLAQWLSKGYVLPSGVNKVKFEATSAYGNNLYLDNICKAGVSGITPLTGIPENYSLSQNYPNPFNPVTVIKYAIPVSGFVNLTVYDLLGNEIAVLVDKYEYAGYHRTEFSGTNLSSGVYFYRIQSGNFTDMKKMTLIK